MDCKELQMKSDVIRRVRSIHYMRTVLRPFLVKITLFVVSIVGASSLVSVRGVWTSMIEHETSSSIGYMSYAFFETSFTVQIILVLAVVLLALMVVDFVRNVKYIRSLELIKA